MAIGGGTVINSPNDSQSSLSLNHFLRLPLKKEFSFRSDKLRSNIEQLENELCQCKDTIRNLNKILDEKEKAILDYENRLIVNERKHALELRAENDKQRQLKIELEQRSTLIAQLTNQLYRQKQQQTQIRPQHGQMILPDKPKKLKNIDESKPSLLSDKQQRHSNRSSSLSSQTNSIEQDLNKVLFVGRRPPTPPQQLRPISSKTTESNEKPVFTKRQLQLLNSHTEQNSDTNKINPLRPPMKLSPVLPPIINRKVPLHSLATTGKFPQEGEV